MERNPLSQREPIFNVPGVIAGLLASFVAVHVLRTLLLPEAQSDWLTAALAFIPARYSGLAGEIPGGSAAIFTSPLTHQFVHGDLTHLLINSAWLLAFGTPVARRTDTLRFLAFFLLAGVSGALFYLALNPGAFTMVVGASGAISGLMGAAFRFLFGPLRDRDVEGLAGEIRRPPLTSLGETLRDRRVLLAIVGWTLLNIVLAWSKIGVPDDTAGIAWEAHLGGFYMGLLTYGVFDGVALGGDGGPNTAVPE
jgi:membrane associated rhomboid family serine protease